MITALDSSVLLAIFNGEPGAEGWLDALMKVRREGTLVLCDIVYAELVPSAQSRAVLDRNLSKLGAVFDPLAEAAAWEAGRIFREYRKAGGPRDSMIPDFLIGAHAVVQADRLAAIDRGYLRRYFPKLKLLAPRASGEQS